MMGDDWCRMHIVGNARNELVRLIHEGAQAFQRWGAGLSDDLHPLLQNQAESDGERESARRQWLAANEALNRLVEVESHNENTAVPSCHRMSPIGRNDVFPAEWRIEAYRAYLPEEVLDKLKQWQGYISDVKAGAYRGYLFEWYLYATSTGVYDFCTTLRCAAEEARERDNNWAMRLKSTAVIDRIEDSSLKPPVYPAPRWVEWKDRGGHVRHEQDERYAQLEDTITRLLTLQREWNRQVPSNQKLTFKLRTFETYLNQAHWDHLDSLFNWLTQCMRDGMGLYLSV
jgi:hypothetical protein